VPALTRRLEKRGPWWTEAILEALGTMGAAAKPAVPQILKQLEGADHKVPVQVAVCWARSDRPPRKRFPNSRRS
jgi:hypothetical protein